MFRDKKCARADSNSCLVIQKQLEVTRVQGESAPTTYGYTYTLYVDQAISISTFMANTKHPEVDITFKRADVPRYTGYFIGDSHGQYCGCSCVEKVVNV